VAGHRAAGGAHSFPCDGRVEQLLPSQRDLASRVQEHAERRDREEQAVEDHNLRRVAEASEVLCCVVQRCRVRGLRPARRTCELYTTPRILFGFGPNGFNR